MTVDNSKRESSDPQPTTEVEPADGKAEDRKSWPQSRISRPRMSDGAGEGWKIPGPAVFLIIAVIVIVSALAIATR